MERRGVTRRTIARGIASIEHRPCHGMQVYLCRSTCCTTLLVRPGRRFIPSSIHPRPQRAFHIVFILGSAQIQGGAYNCLNLAEREGFEPSKGF